MSLLTCGIICLRIPGIPARLPGTAKLSYAKIEFGARKVDRITILNKGTVSEWKECLINLLFKGIGDFGGIQNVSNFSYISMYAHVGMYIHIYS